MLINILLNFLTFHSPEIVFANFATPGYAVILN